MNESKHRAQFEAKVRDLLEAHTFFHGTPDELRAQIRAAIAEERQRRRARHHFGDQADLDDIEAAL